MRLRTENNGINIFLLISSYFKYYRLGDELQVESGNIRFELFSYEKKIPRKKCFEMLDILIKYYNNFNGMDNG